MKTTVFCSILFGLFFLNPICAQLNTNFDCGMTEETQSEESSSSQICNHSFTSFKNNHVDDMIPQGIDRTLKIHTNVIFMQNDDGEGNFTMSNDEHVMYWNRVFDSINYRLKNIVEQNCNCPTMPYHYTNLHIEFVPRYIEIKNSYYWNHRHDADSNTLNSSNKAYLNAIYNLATQTPGYVDGYAWIITTDSVFWKRWTDNNGTIPWWLQGYDCLHNGVYTSSDTACVNYSGSPDYDLNHPAMWHNPDKYLNFINYINHVAPVGQAAIDRDIPATAGGALHEYLHYFGLNHPLTGQCLENIMKQDGGSKRKALSGCQVRTMYETLMSKNLRKYVTCEDRLDFNLTVDNNETWTVDTRVFGDILIKDSSSLTITCKVAMDPNAKIIVSRGGKLILDGGYLTSDCEEKWNGIIVEGDVPGKQARSGKVILKSNAVIELAKTAISMYPSHIAWNNGDQQKYYGGIVEARSSTFQNCNKAVEFMKYDSLGLRDKSFFSNVVFENLTSGVTIWADDGITFDSCTFKNITKRGIYAYDSEIIARSNNRFEQMPIGIDILTTYPRLFSSKIGQVGSVVNQFKSNTGINIQSTGNIEELAISNNFFEGTENHDKGIHVNGNGLFNIQRNTFGEERKSIEIYDSGDKMNLIMNNEFDDSWIASHSIKSNLGLRYLDNCFSSSSFMDIAVTVGGIFPFQGTPSFGAGNCFTKNQITEVYNASSDPVKYYVKGGTASSACQYPVNLINVTLDPNALNQRPLTCGSGPIPPIPFVHSTELCDIDDQQTIQNLKQQRTNLIQAMSNASSGSYNKSNYAQCIEVLESLITYKMLDRNSTDASAGKENSISFLTGSGMDFRDSITAFGILVNNGELSRARTFINTLNPRNSEQTNVIYTENINLDYLLNPAAYQLTTTVKNQLYSIGSTDGAYNGYARSLYEVLTGDRMDLDIPLSWRSSEPNQTNLPAPSLRAFPNPNLDGNINLEVQNLPSGNYKITLYTSLGTSITHIDITESGLYTI
ncbi:MAG: right-handed parallel beta-helix repeat-containing protein, partial [Saprospiraceae bacterium]